MGDFSYICKHCGKSIRMGERCVMIHVRHGKELGRANGVYEGYGEISGNIDFRNEEEGNPNSHYEICISEYDEKDSRRIVKKEKAVYNKMKNKLDTIDIISMNLNENLKYKLFEGKPISLLKFAEIKSGKSIKKSDDYQDKLFDYQEEYLSLSNNPNLRFPIRSGIVAYHEKCYDEEVKNSKTHEIKNLRPSREDPNQGWGTPRKEFI